MTRIVIAAAGGGSARDAYRVTLHDDDGTTTTHTVTVPEPDRDTLASGASPEDLLEKAFLFLLTREPKESILPEFAIMDIRVYFPDFPDAMRAAFAAADNPESA